MPDIGSLIDDHEALDAIARALMTHAELDTGSTGELRDLMTQYAIVAGAHVEAEAPIVYDDHAKHDRYSDAALSFREEFGLLMDGWMDFYARWDEAAIARDRTAFNREVLALMASMRRRIDRENNILYPLALDAGRLSLRRASRRAA